MVTRYRITFGPGAAAYLREWYVKTGRWVTPPRNWVTIEELTDDCGVCRSGCATQDHASYAECLKAAAIQIGNLK